MLNNILVCDDDTAIVDSIEIYLQHTPVSNSKVFLHLLLSPQPYTMHHQVIDERVKIN